jgi:hypothetical protein
MTYLLRLHIRKEKSWLELLKNNEMTASREWPEARDMGRKLFEAIEGLLKEEGIAPEMVGEFEVLSEVPEMFTSARIAETVKRVYAFGVVAKKA